MVRIYPLLFEPSLHAKVWGGHWLESQLGKELPSGQPVGEAWEIFWKNHITNGVHQGRTLGELIAEFPQEMVGSAQADPEFPLLIKFLDAQDWLSVQVHPNDELAMSLEGQPRGKTECWYIIHAKPDAQIAYGLSTPLDADQLRDAIQTGHAKDVLQYVNVQAGDFIPVPAGTLHAVGPGILLYECQQTSDTTYRLYDWDRVGLDGQPRPLHLDKALRCTHLDVNPVAKYSYDFQRVADGVYRASLILNSYFGLDKLMLQQEFTLETQGTQAYSLTAIDGHVECRGVDQPPILLPQGTSAFIPAGMGQCRLIPDGKASVLVAWYPG